MENNQEPEQQNYDFTDEQRAEILEKEFIFGSSRDKCQKKKLSEIIDWIINNVKKKDDYGEVRDCIRKYWFTKQIEEWKKNNNTDKEPNDYELMNIVKEDLKVRIANTMLALRKQQDIKEKDIWFDNKNNYASIVKLRNNDNIILKISQFNDYYFHNSPPYKPFFMKNQNDNYKINGVCIYKHGNDESKTKWIMACFKDDITEPQCKITFQTNENDKITNVEIETEKNRNSKSTYTISLNEAGEVEKITKNCEEENKDKNNYNNEIKQLLFEDKINKVLIENIECELDTEQKVVFDTIKEYLGIKEEHDKKKRKK